MNLVLNMLGLLLVAGITLLGIVGSGLLAARRMTEAEEPVSRRDTAERKTQS